VLLSRACVQLLLQLARHAQKDVASSARQGAAAPARAKRHSEARCKGADGDVVEAAASALDFLGEPLLQRRRQPDENAASVSCHIR
jgi:hypothetical protein